MTGIPTSPASADASAPAAEPYVMNWETVTESVGASLPRIERIVDDVAHALDAVDASARAASGASDADDVAFDLAAASALRDQYAAQGAYLYAHVTDMAIRHYEATCEDGDPADPEDGA